MIDKARLPRVRPKICWINLPHALTCQAQYADGKFIEQLIYGMIEGMEQVHFTNV